MGTIVTNRNEVHDECRGEIHFGDICTYSFTERSIPYIYQNAEYQHIQNNFAFFQWIPKMILSVRKGYKFQVFGNNIKKMFVPTRDEVTAI
jgi:hypothetical protein